MQTPIPPISQMTPDVMQELIKELLEYRKEVCKNCRGKGYSTYYHGVRGSADLDLEAWEAPKEININYCNCRRGNQLQKLLGLEKERSKLRLLKRLYRMYQARKLFLLPKSDVLKGLKGIYDFYRNRIDTANGHKRAGNESGD